MLDSITSIFSATTNSEVLSLGSTIISMGAALIFGLLISLIYMHTHKKEGYATGFPITLIMLPAIISVIILLIGNNVARAFSLAGAFSLIRFRSAPGEPKDIAYVLATLAIGLACGMGYIPYALTFAIILAAVMLILHYTNFAQTQSDAMQLKITVPENLNYKNLFDDILNDYASGWKLRRVKTSDFGTLFEVTYDIQLKQDKDQKALFDAIRCRNGNLNIVLTLRETEVNY